MPLLLPKSRCSASLLREVVGVCAGDHRVDDRVLRLVQCLRREIERVLRVELHVLSTDIGLLDIKLGTTLVTLGLQRGEPRVNGRPGLGPPRLRLILCGGRVRLCFGLTLADRRRQPRPLTLQCGTILRSRCGGHVLRLLGSNGQFAQLLG